MSTGKIANDATSSAEGTILQLYIALGKCFEMTSGQKIIIERFGDVTVSANQQIEVKNYGAPLTDSHVNFWKTLHNWMRPEFDHSFYLALILCTTQQIGKTSRLRAWNAATVPAKLDILTAIYQEAEQREKQRLADPAQKKQSPSDSYRYQTRIMDGSQRTKLEEVVSRVVIADSSPDIEGVYDRLKDVQGKYVLRGKCDDFLLTLLGFVISPSVLTGTSWEIGYEAFSEKVRSLVAQFCKGTTRFPTKFRRSEQPTERDIRARDNRFIEKIKAIEYDQMIPKAVMDYLYASDTAIKDLKNYEVPPESFTIFANSVRDQFTPKYSRALRNVRDVISDSKDFYDTMMAEPVPAFPGFDQPDFSFRNGVLHMHCDDASANVKWRLE